MTWSRVLLKCIFVTFWNFFSNIFTTGIPTKDVTSETIVQNSYYLCPNLMNLSRVLNQPKTGLNLAPA